MDFLFWCLLGVLAGYYAVVIYDYLALILTGVRKRRR